MFPVMVVVVASAKSKCVRLFRDRGGSYKTTVFIQHGKWGAWLGSAYPLLVIGLDQQLHCDNESRTRKKSRRQAHQPQAIEKLFVLAAHQSHDRRVLGQP